MSTEIVGLGISLLGILALFGLSIASRLIESWRPASVYFVGGVMGAVLGLIVSYVIVHAIGRVPIHLTEIFVLPEWVDKVCEALACVILILGALVTWPLGTALGCIAGVCCVSRHHIRSSR